MAAADDHHGNQTMRDRDVRHACCLCMEPYRGRHPKILPCFHTFCLPCLTALQASAVTANKKLQSDTDKKNDDDEKDDDNGDGKDEKSPPGKMGVADGSGDGIGDNGDDGEGDGDGDKGREAVLVFLCPTCRAPVCVPEGGVSCLQTNFYVIDDDDDEEAITPPPPSLCDMCEEGEKESAVCHCHQCQQAMCRTCRRYHDKLTVTAQHAVTAIVTSPDDRGKEEKEKEKKGVCLVHQDQALCFYCCQCQVPLCLHCKLTSHERHDTVDMSSAVVTAKKEMGPLIERAQEQIQVLDSYFQHMDNEDSLLTHHARRLSRQISERHHTLLTWAADAHLRLTQEVKVKEAACRGRLMAERCSGTSLRLSVSSPLSRATQTLNHMAGDWDGDAVMVRNQLQQALLPQDTLSRFQDTARGGHQPWGWGYSVEGEEGGGVLGEEHVQAFMGRVVEGADTGESRETPPLLSGRELADRVDKMTSQMTSLENDITALQQKEEEMINTMKKREDNLHGKMDSQNADIQKKLKSAEDERGAMKKTEDDIRNTTKALQRKIDTGAQMISFIATGIDKSKTRNCSPMVFNSIKVNHGGCYDNATGHFTATLSGCYIFTASIGSRMTDVNVMAAFVVDETQYTIIRGSISSVGCGSVSVQLKKGQKVWVKADSDPSKYYSSELCFTGALVQPEL